MRIRIVWRNLWGLLVLAVIWAVVAGALDTPRFLNFVVGGMYGIAFPILRFDSDD